METFPYPWPMGAGSFPDAPICCSASGRRADRPGRAMAGESSQVLRRPQARDAAARATAPGQPPSGPEFAPLDRPGRGPPECCQDRTKSQPPRIRIAPANQLLLPTPRPQSAACPAGRGPAASVPSGCTVRSVHRRRPTSDRQCSAIPPLALIRFRWQNRGCGCAPAQFSLQAGVILSHTK